MQVVGVLTEKTGIMLRCKNPRADEDNLTVYSKIEIVAEKVRALIQQQEKWPRPRDLYDLWYITCHKGEMFDRSHLRRLFEQKCRIRGIPADISRLQSKHLYEWNREAWTSQLLTMLKTAPEYDLIWTEWTAKCKELFGGQGGQVLP